MQQQAVGPRSCLVAVDGSGAGVDALVWALRHAVEHDATVEVLTVWPDHHSPLVHEVPGHFCAARWEALVAQQDTVRRATERAASVPVLTTSLENAEVADAIVRASTRHDLVVLGPSHGSHRLTDRIVHESARPVVVVGSPRHAPAPREPARQEPAP